MIMKTHKITNTKQLIDALFNSKDNDTLEIASGEYFPTNKTPYLRIEHNLILKGTGESDATVLNCGFIIDKTLVLNNLTLNFNKITGNNVSLYDGAKLYCDNVVINHSIDNQWSPIYCQNSAISLQNSEILETNSSISGIRLENSQLFSDNSAIQFLSSKNSIIYLKDSFISYSLCLQDKSTLTFNDLTIDSLNNSSYSDFYVDNHSKVTGQNLTFIKDSPFIDVLDSNFETSDFESGLQNIRWRFNETSFVLADGQEPYNDAE